MAAANESSVTEVNILEGGAKELLLERYSDLKFVDDVTDVKCKRCDRVLIYHYLANCGHLFCKNCRRVLSNGEGWRCPQCKEYVTSIEEQKLEVEERVYGLMVHCLNHKYGCKEIMPLRQITKHLEVCEDTKEANLPMFYEGTNSLEAVMKRMGEMSEEMRQLREAIDQSQKPTEDRIYRKLSDELRELLSSQTETENKLKQVEDNQRRDVERMEQKMLIWNNNILIETTRAQTQTEDRCNLKIKEMDDNINQLKQQVKEVRMNVSAVESQVVDQTKELSTEIKRLGEDSSQNKDHVSAELAEFKNYHKKAFSEHDSKCTNRMDKLYKKWTTAEVKNQIGELNHSQEEMKAEHSNTLQEIRKIIQESDESQRQDFQLRLEQLEQSLMAKFGEDHSQQQAEMEMKLNERRNDPSNKLTDTGIQDKTPSAVSGQSSNSVKEYNILLLGPSGAGKSLFLNCVHNHLKYKTFEEASNGGLLTCGKYGNGEMTEGQSIYEDCRCYELDCGDFKIRLISSPDFESKGHPDEDVRNMENIFETISRYDHLDAIAIVVDAEADEHINASFNLILAHLHKSAASNIAFIVTDTAYIEHIGIRISDFVSHFSAEKFIRRYSLEANKTFVLRGPYNAHENRYIYAMDITGYLHLIQRLNGKFKNEKPFQYFVESWNYSVKEIGRFLNDIVRGTADNRFQPQLVKNTMAIYEARRLMRIIDPILQPIISNDPHLQSVIAVRDKLKGSEIKAKAGSEKGEHVWVCQSKKCQTSVTMNAVRRVFHAQHCGEGFNSTGLFSNECSVCSCHKTQHTKMPSVCADREAASNKYEVERYMKDPPSDRKNRRGEHLFIQSAMETFENFTATNALVRTPDTESIDLDSDIIYEIKDQLFNLSYYGARIKAAYDKDVADRKIRLGNIGDNTTTVEGAFNLDEYTVEIVYNNIQRTTNFRHFIQRS